MSISARSGGIRPALTNGLRVGVEHDVPLLFCESRGETTGDGETAEGRELTSEPLAPALSIDELELGSELLDVANSGDTLLVLKLSP